MSRYQVALIRAALLWLLLTAGMGLLFFVAPRFVGALRVVHVHLGVLGFFLSLVMGVAYWLMPRPGGLRQERLEGWTFWLFHPALALRAVAETWLRTGGPDWLRGALIVAGALLFAAIAIFVVAMFRRVRTAEAIRRLRSRERPAA